MPDAAEQPGDGLDLESHLEALLGEIEATQVEVEAESVRPDEPNPDALDPGEQTPTPSGDTPTPNQDDGTIDRDGELVGEPEGDRVGDSTLETIAEIESDLGDLVDAIYDLESGGAEPMSEAPVEDAAPAEADAQEPEPEAEMDHDPTGGLADEILSELDLPGDTPASDETNTDASENDDGFGMALDDLAGSIEQMLASGDETAAPATAPDPETPIVEETIDDTAVDAFPDEQTPDEEPNDEALGEAAPTGSGDSLDDMLAAASEELLADEADETLAGGASDAPEATIDEDDEPEAQASAGEELLDAVEQLGELEPSSAQIDNEENADPGEVAAGVVEIPGAPSAPEGAELVDAAPADEPVEQHAQEAPDESAAAGGKQPAQEPATVETIIPPEPEPLAPPTGRLAPLIIAWRTTRRVVEPAARRAAPVLGEAVLAVGKPLRDKPKSVRDTVGWIAIYTAFLALCLWIFALGFRSASPPDVGDSDARVVLPEDGAPPAPVP